MQKYLEEALYFTLFLKKYKVHREKIIVPMNANGVSSILPTVSAVLFISPFPHRRTPEGRVSGNSWTAESTVHHSQSFIVIADPGSPPYSVLPCSLIDGDNWPEH